MGPPNFFDVVEISFFRWLIIVSICIVALFLIYHAWMWGDRNKLDYGVIALPLVIVTIAFFLCQFFLCYQNPTCEKYDDLSDTYERAKKMQETQEKERWDKIVEKVKKEKRKIKS